MQKLTTRQAKFVQFYDGNATKAAIKAGYSKKTARSQAQRLLTNVYIKDAIKKRQDKENLPTIATRLERQQFWTETVRDKTQPMQFRQKASEFLSKSEGDFLDRIEHSGEIDTGITVITTNKTIKL